METTPLTPDDVRAIVREEIGINKPLLLSDVVGDADKAREAARAALAGALEATDHPLATTSISQAGPLTITHEWCACGAKGRMTVRGSGADLLGGRRLDGDRLNPQDLRLQDADGGDEGGDDVSPGIGRLPHQTRRSESLVDLEFVLGRPDVHENSSSVVPGAGHTRADHTVEVTGDTARVDSSPRRVAGTRRPASIVRSRVRAAWIREQVASGDLEPDWLDVAADIEQAADQAEAVQA